MRLLSGRLAVAAGVVLAVTGLLAFSLAGPSTILGQETDVGPPATQSIVISADDTTPAVGGAVTLSVGVLDADGNPVASEDCTFSILSQPGTDASVDAGPVTTDADGNASVTLEVGSTPGAIEVEAQCGDVSATVSVVAGLTQQGTGADDEEPAAPPASLPDTGSSGPSQTAGSTTVLLATILSALGVALAAAGMLAARRARRVRAQ